MSLISRKTVKCDIGGCDSSFFEEHKLILKTPQKFLTLPETWTKLNCNDVDYFICPMHEIVIQVDHNIIIKRHK